MPQTKSRRKHVRQAEKRRERNRSLKKAIKVATRAVLEGLPRAATHRWLSLHSARHIRL